jgi:Holliday junction DNA helicase RuvA
MINSIAGELTFKAKDKAFIRNSGIEWDISISTTTFSRLPVEGSECKLQVLLYHREDKMQLFGFSTVEERNLFFDLIKVESIGPASALKILSGVTPEDLGRAIDAGNADLLSGIPGIGKKTAEKIVFKLKGKIVVSGEEPMHEEIAKALSGMGFDLGQSRNAVRDAAKEIDTAGLGRDELEKELLKSALKRMSRAHG